MNAEEYRTEEQNQMRITGLRILAQIIARELLAQPRTGAACLTASAGALLAALGVRRFNDIFVIE